VNPNANLLSPGDIFWSNEGPHFRLYEKLGAHLSEREGFPVPTSPPGLQTRVRCPSVETSTDGISLPARSLTESFQVLWKGFLPEVGQGAMYKYYVVSRNRAHTVDKAGPCAFFGQVPPDNASVV
jgi:1,4-alpha-glucan branching enzyme